MKPSTELFDLIHSLTKSEKRFFKLNSTLQSGEKNYLKLFDYIVQLKKYDESELKDYFKDEKFIQHLPSEKNHLYKLILKSLRSFYSGNSVSSQLRLEIKNIEILYRKALFRECYKVLRSAKKLAVRYEKFYYWFELISWQKQLFDESSELMSVDSFDDLVVEETMVIEKLRNLAEYQILYSRINAIFRFGGFARNEEERQQVMEIANNHLIKGKNTAISVRATTICYYIKGLCFATNREFDASFENFTKVLSIMEKNPMISSDLPKRYILTLWHLFNCHIEVRDFKSGNKIVNKIDHLLNNKGYDATYIQLQIKSYVTIARLQSNCLSGNFSDNLDKIEEINEFIDEYGSKLNKEKNLLITYFISYTYFGLGKYKKSLQYLNLILNDKENHIRQDIFSFSRIFNLLLHYELGNKDFLEYAVKSTSRHAKKVTKDYEFEKLIIAFVNKLAKKEDDKHVKLFEDISKSINNLLEDPKERVFLNFFNIRSWVLSKKDDIPFHNAIKINAKKNALQAVN